jgi:hypothetical protein
MSLVLSENQLPLVLNILSILLLAELKQLHKAKAYGETSKNTQHSSYDECCHHQGIILKLQLR